MLDLEERPITCPYCWEIINVMLDPSLPEQIYIEDCSVCCHPMQLRVVSNDGHITDLSCERTDV